MEINTFFMTCFQHCRLMESIVSLYCRTTSCLVEKDGIISQVCLSLTFLSRQELLHAMLFDSIAQKLFCHTSFFLPKALAPFLRGQDEC